MCALLKRGVPLLCYDNKRCSDSAPPSSLRSYHERMPHPPTHPPSCDCSQLTMDGFQFLVRERAIERVLQEQSGQVVTALIFRKQLVSTRHAQATQPPASPFSSSHLGQHDDTLLLEFLNDQITHRRLPTRCGKGRRRADRTHACQLGTPTLEGTQPPLSRTGPARDADEKGLLPLAPSPAMRAAQSAVLTQ